MSKFIMIDENDWTCIVVVKIISQKCQCTAFILN